MLWVFPSLGQLWKYLGPMGTVVAAISGLGMSAIAASYALDRWPKQISPRLLLVASSALLVMFFIVLFPVAQSHILGPGSDRADAIDVCLRALFDGRSPYDAVTYLGNPPTPLPGALLLGLPFYLLGTSALQNPVWFIGFTHLAPDILRSDRGAAALIASQVLFSPAAEQDFVTGGDYLTNVLYVAVAMHFALRVQPTRHRATRLAVFVFYAVCISSRPFYLVTAPIVAAAILHGHGLKRAAEFAMTAGIAVMGLNLPFYLADPTGSPLFLAANKLTAYPDWLHAAFLLPALGLMVALGSFWAKLSEERMFLFATLSLAPLFLPTIALNVLPASSIAEPLTTASYAMPISIFSGIWLLGLWPTKDPVQPSRSL